MALDLLRECTFTGPALPEPFVALELERALTKAGLLARTTGGEARALQGSWDAYRRKLRDLAVRGGPIRVRNHVFDPLVQRLGYAVIEATDDVETREGKESGGFVLSTGDVAGRLRAWCTDLDEDLDAPARRGAAFRYSHVRVAQRVLLAVGERVGLLTNGIELRILISDPARPDSQVVIPIDPLWKRSREVPDSYRLLLALASPAGVKAVPALVEQARLQQARVTKGLRVQARQAVERFVQGVLDQQANRSRLAEHHDRNRLARELWREGLITVYRLLFLLKLESSDDPARSFSFASTSLWRNTFSPSVALAPHVRAVLDGGAETGRLLEDGVRNVFRMFAEGLRCTEIHVEPLGGALFGPEATPVLSGLAWGERAVAHLLDRLLWTPKRKGADTRQRVHYGPLDVEDLGRVYEALLELEPGVASEPMCRLRRQKLEVVVPFAQGEKYRAATASETSEEDAADADVDEEDDEESAPGNKTKVEWIEEIPPGSFYLRVGLGRKSTGSYYTPHSFVRFLVQETLGPQVAERSPKEDPRPAEILKLKVLDPAMGSGHFLVEACRFLGDRLYEACRLCDERALAAEARAEKARSAEERSPAEAEAADYRRRVVELPDPDDELVRYLPSRAPEGQESGLSQRKAEALCRRLVAVHCLYGVDKNPLAVELAKLSLWIEAHAEGLPLTFLDHRLVLGDSLTGPFFEHLLKYPGSQKPLDDLFTRGLRESFTRALSAALTHVHDLEATVGATLPDVEAKRAAKARLDQALAPFRIVAAAWAGGVMLGPEACDDVAYAALVRSVSENGSPPADLLDQPRLKAMVARGFGLDGDGGGVPALPYDLAFAEVFFPESTVQAHRGFDAVLGNPPWDAIQFKSKEFFAAFDFEILSAPTKRERTAIEKRLIADAGCGPLFERYKESFEEIKRDVDALYDFQKIEIEGDLAGRQMDSFRVFMERNSQLLGPGGWTGVVVPSAFHANEGATGVRRLYLEQMALRCCYSFENRRKLFEIDSRFKFALVVASRGAVTESFPCAFYLHDDEWLFAERQDRTTLTYDLPFVRRTGGEYLSLLELRSAHDSAAAQVCYEGARTFGQACEATGIRFGRELDMTNHAALFVATHELLSPGEDPRDLEVAIRLRAQGYVPLLEGKSFWHFDDHWEDRPRYLVQMATLEERPDVLRAACYFRLAFRDIARSTDERTAFFALLSPGLVFGNTAPCERQPQNRPNSEALWLEAVTTTFSFDWLLRLKSAAHLNYFILNSCPLPNAGSRMDVGRRAFLVHCALRLTCNHAGFEPLWCEQLDDHWREPTKAFSWPVIAGAPGRWQVRAAMDALVGHAYGLSREQYAHVLAGFSHKGYPQTPALCLARFEELAQLGTETFLRKYDPYHDVPLSQDLPEPAIVLPLPAALKAGGAQAMLALHLEADGASRSAPPLGLSKAAERAQRSRPEASASEDDAYRRLRDLISDRGVITSAEAQALLETDAVSVRPLLKRLVTEGLAVTEGQRRGLKYRYRQPTDGGPA